jgi:hypothetical protein
VKKASTMTTRVIYKPAFGYFYQRCILKYTRHPREHVVKVVTVEKPLPTGIGIKISNDLGSRRHFNGVQQGIKGTLTIA